MSMPLEVSGSTTNDLLKCRIAEKLARAHCSLRDTVRVFPRR